MALSRTAAFASVDAHYRLTFDRVNVFVGELCGVWGGAEVLGQERERERSCPNFWGCD